MRLTGGMVSLALIWLMRPVTGTSGLLSDGLPGNGMKGANTLPSKGSQTWGAGRGDGSTGGNIGGDNHACQHDGHVTATCYIFMRLQPVICL